MAQQNESRENPADPRIYFAAERTLLAWVRTGLAMMGFGFVVARFGLFLRMLASERGFTPRQPSWLSLSMGTTLVIVGVMANVHAAFRYWRTVRRLDMGQTIPFSPLSPGTLVAGLLGILGIVMAAYLLFGLNDQH